MTAVDNPDILALSKSQLNIYHGVLQDTDPGLYLIARRYRFGAIPLNRFLDALRTTILRTPIQLCVLDLIDDHPVLVPRLDPDDLIAVRSIDDRGQPDHELETSWRQGIVGKPLARYTLWTEEPGRQLIALDIRSHHILIDGAGTGIVESTLGKCLAGGKCAEPASLQKALDTLRRAHRHEADKTENARSRFGDTIRAELAAQARVGAGHHPHGTPVATSAAAAKGVLTESVVLSGSDYDALLDLAEHQQVPLNVLVAAAAVAVDAGTRQSTDTLLVHAVDNRFGDPELDAATCLVNSVAHSVSFPPFASAAELVRTVDRGYVKALRRRWLREEHYRRMYLAINRTSNVEALTLNFLPEPCAPELRTFLTEVPTTTDIGPIESPTVAAVLDEQQRTLTLTVWDRDYSTRRSGVAEKIRDVLAAMPDAWHKPVAMLVGQWLELTEQGTLQTGHEPADTGESTAGAWFLDPSDDVRRWLDGRRYVQAWITWLVDSAIATGDIVVISDDQSDAAIDLLVACHLAGCAYSVCDDAEQLPARARALSDTTGATAHIIDVATTRLDLSPDSCPSEAAVARRHQVSRDVSLATSTAYVMPTSGSTGAPKLVPVTHRALAVFCDAVRRAYGWRRDDVILQCAPLTSDISIEEVFVAAFTGARVIRSAATGNGDLQMLVRDIASHAVTVVDLPTAVWHLLCDDPDSVAEISRSRLRQIIIGGEAIRPSAVDKWGGIGHSAPVTVISTYGPTETTVVVAQLPVVEQGRAVQSEARRRIGRPVVPRTVFVAFGEIVILGPMVSPGYLGTTSTGFGLVHGSDGSVHRAFATADRVSTDGLGFPIFAGRRDAVVKVSGRRVDTAQLTSRITELPGIVDVAVDLDDGRLGVWFETRQTRSGAGDPRTEAAIRAILTDARVPTFFVLGVPSVLRKANGKVDCATLRAHHHVDDPDRTASAHHAASLAAVWSRHLELPLTADSSLLDAGVGSYDLIRILPATRRHLGRQVTILDLISADSAAALVAESATESWLDEAGIEQITEDFAAVRHHAAASLGPMGVPKSDSGPVVVLGASGVVGTGFVEAAAAMKAAGTLPSQIIGVTRRPMPLDVEPWASALGTAEIALHTLSGEITSTELAQFLRDTGAATVINCIGNANMVVPYAELRASNVELVSMLVETCTSIDAALVHLSTYSVNSKVDAPRVLDPRTAPYPYAASKALAELIVAGSPATLQYTMVRLPRILPGRHQLSASADILISVVDACRALRARPAGTVAEEVTTARSAAQAILELATGDLGRSISVLRGETVDYGGLLGQVATELLDVAEWKRRLDDSAWARAYPRRWSVIDGWLTLGERLRGRSYSEYLADYPTIDLDVESVSEIMVSSRPITEFLFPGTQPGLAATNRSALQQ